MAAIRFKGVSCRVVTMRRAPKWSRVECVTGKKFSVRGKQRDVGKVSVFPGDNRIHIGNVKSCSKVSSIHGLKSYVCYWKA